MKTEAIIVGADGVARLEAIELPELTPTRVRIQTLLSGISCGTEGDATSGRAVYMARPFVAGYQAAGIVVAVGQQVRRVREGDVVFTRGGGLWGRTHLFGGSHARQSVAEEADVIPLANGNPSLPTVAYALLGAVAMEGLCRMKLRADGVLLVFGLGMLGQLAGQIGQALGLRVIGVNRSAWKRDAARARVRGGLRPGGRGYRCRVAGRGATAICGGDDGIAIDLRPRAGDAGRIRGVEFAGILSGTVSSRFQPLPPQPTQPVQPGWLGRQIAAGHPAHRGGGLNIEPLIRHTVRPQQITEFYADLVRNRVSGVNA